jgi:hypothetical protein
VLQKVKVIAVPYRRRAGNALYSNRASTNLHLDMSDAVNLLVYVGLPDDCDAQENIKLVLQQVINLIIKLYVGIQN